MDLLVPKGAAAALFGLALSCLTALAPPVAEATFPGKPGLIAFNLLTFSGGGEPVGGLYTIRPGQQRPRQLTDNPRDYSPSFAPSGKKLVFHRTDSVDSELDGIYTLDLSSGKATRITSRGSDQTPAFGPDGTVVFSRPVSGDSYDLFLRTAKGRLRRLTSDSGRDQEPIFTPDGERILFARDYKRYVPLSFLRNEPEREGLYSISTDGSGLRFIRDLRPGASSFDVSPDGPHVAFAGIGGLSYSPDGHRIAYANYEGLWLRPVDGKGKPTLILEANSNGSDPRQLLIQPAWQPLP